MEEGSLRPVIAFIFLFLLSTDYIFAQRSKKNSNGQNFKLIYCVFEAVKIPKIINVGITNKADIAFFNVFINIIFVYLFDLLILFPF